MYYAFCHYQLLHSSCVLPGVQGDGDITKTDNLLSLQEHVVKGTGGQGVHFVMGDGK